MPMTVKVDRQGRVVIPLRERERLGVEEGGVLELVPTTEGLLLEPRRQAAVDLHFEGLPVVTVQGLGMVSNEQAVAALHRQRNRE